MMDKIEDMMMRLMKIKILVLWKMIWLVGALSI
jgi:hypothetical protein